MLNLSATPEVPFPFQKELDDNIRRFKYLLKLANDWEYFLNMGLDSHDAAELIIKIESKNLSLENYRD